MAKARHVHHIEYADYSEDKIGGLPALVADFSHSDRPIAHFLGAKTNLERFGKLQLKGDKNFVTFNQARTRITIVGESNCETFHNWTATDCPWLNERLASTGVQFRYSFAALERNSVPVEEPGDGPKKPETPPPAPPAEQLFLFDDPKDGGKRGGGKSR